MRELHLSPIRTLSRVLRPPRWADLLTRVGHPTAHGPLGRHAITLTLLLTLAIPCTVAAQRPEIGISTGYSGLMNLGHGPTVLTGLTFPLGGRSLSLEGHLYWMNEFPDHYMDRCGDPPVTCTVDAAHHWTGKQVALVLRFAPPSRPGRYLLTGLGWMSLTDHHERDIHHPSGSVVTRQNDSHEPALVGHFGLGVARLMGGNSLMTFEARFSPWAQFLGVGDKDLWGGLGGSLTLGVRRAF